MPQSNPSLLKRQKHLLNLLHFLGGKVDTLDFQKFLFLYAMEFPENRFYDFVPYYYGAFSFTSYADWRKLVERGLLEKDENHWILTASGRELAEDAEENFHLLIQKYGHLKGDALVAETYRTYPYSAIHSNKASRLLAQEPEVLEKIYRQKENNSKPGLLTIGYEGHSLESYLNLLIKAGATVLCDVRRNPISRKYGFSKKTLAKACEGVGITYIHFRDLGIESAKRKQLATLADYKKLFEEYKKDVLMVTGESLTKIHRLIQEGNRVVLTCYEHSPQYCHRSYVAYEIERISGCKYNTYDL